MKRWLYLTPQAASAVCYWQGDDTPTCATLEAGAAALSAHPLNLIVPMEMCSALLTEPWPGRRRPNAQTLAFAIEDQLAEDLDLVHVCAGAQDAQQRYPLRVINTQRLNALLRQMSELGLHIEGVYADADLLARDRAYGVWMAERWLIGGAVPCPLAVPAHALQTLKPALPAEMVWLDHTHNTPINRLLSAPGINLLQGAFKPAQTRWPWRRISVALLAVFAVYLGSIEVRSRFLDTESARLWTLNEQRFQALYPNQPRSINLAAQFKALQHPPTHRDHGAMAKLLQVTEHVLGASSVDVQGLQWHVDTGWVVSLTAGSIAELEQLRAQAQRSGLPITMGNASQQENRVIGTLTLENRL